MRTRLLACALLLTACQSGSNPSAQFGKVDHLAIDSSWWRLSTREVGPGGLESWVASHPRLNGAPTDLRARVGASAAILAGRSKLGAPPPVSGTNATMLNWRLDETTPISTSAAVLVLGASMDPTNDRLVIEGGGAGTGSDPSHYIGVLSNIYTATPTVTKSPALDSGIDGSALTTSLDGSIVYAATSGGHVYAVKVADGTFAWQATLPAGVSWSTPWLEVTTGVLYVADVGGHITSFDGTTGTQLFQTMPIAGAGVAVHSSPVVNNGILWVGADDGKLYRFDATNLTALGQGTNLCLNSGACGTFDQIWSGAAIDTTNNQLLIGVNKQIVQIDIGTSGCTSTSTTCTFTAFPIDDATLQSPQARFYSSPFIDTTAGYAYFPFANRLWRSAYTTSLSGTMERATTADPTGLLRGVNPTDDGYPRGLVISFGGQLFVGDGGGFIHRFSASTFSETALQSFANSGTGTPGPNGPAIDSTPLIDVTGGNVYFGVKNPNAPMGSWVSLPQTFPSDPSVTPGSATHLRLTTSATATPGTALTVTVTALDSGNNTATAYTGTVRFASSDAGAMRPANYTFVAGDNGVHQFSVTLNTAGTQTITAIDTNVASNGIVGATSVCVSGATCGTVVSSDKASYATNEIIVLSYGLMQGNTTDYVAISPQGSSASTQTAFSYTNGEINGARVFTPIGTGTYEPRAYFNNSFTIAATGATFTVGSTVTTVVTDKTTYSEGDTVTVTFTNMQGSATDWIGIAPSSAAADTSYIVFKYTGGAVNGSVTFNNIPQGTGYVARAYFNNNFVRQAQSASFDVNAAMATVSAAQATFAPGQNVVINFTGMSSDPTDWIGIYAPGASDQMYINWRYTGGAASGSVNFSTTLAPGTYEARAFLNNVFFKVATSMTFVVQ